MTLMTIGYEGLDITAFLAALRSNHVTTLIDVRELPLSRKKGFSKSALSAAAEQAGIRYLHMPALGCPRDVRKDYYADQNWARYKKRFNVHLKTQEAALEILLRLTTQEKCCLTCYEADYRYCHRSLISAVLARNHSVTIKHLSLRNRTTSFGLIAA